jgi:pimeloyl-ACP methyl ester carboxylesterase
VPSVIERGFIEVAGVKTYRLQAGRGEPVLLLHGLGASSYSWRSVIESLAESFSVTAVDFPGAGRSAQPRDFDYSLEGYSRWVLALQDALGIQAGNLIGNSMGGLVSLWTALKAPERVKTMALLGTPTYIDCKPRLLWPMRWPVIGRLYEWSIGPWAIPIIARSAFLDPSLITEELVAEYGLAIKTAQGRRAVAEFIRNAVPKDALEQLSRYGELRQPTLVVIGEQDTLVGWKNAERFSKEVPGARFHLLARCGHAPQEEVPGVVTGLLRDFLAPLSP